MGAVIGLLLLQLPLGDIGPHRFACQQRRIDDAGADSRDADRAALGDQFHRQHIAQAQHRVFTRGVRADVGRPQKAGERSDIDDAAWAASRLHGG